MSTSSSVFPDDKGISSSSNVPVWIYVIFRKNPSSGHDKVTLNVSSDGPVFWDRHVVYVFCCSCHFEKHERELIQLLDRCRTRVERVCLVDRPVDYPFLPDSLFSYFASQLPKLQFVYLRELDLEKINRATVENLSRHRQLKKLIVHGCRNYEALQDFRNLPQLLVVKGDIMGLKAMLGDMGEYPEPSPQPSSSSGSEGRGSVPSSASENHRAASVEDAEFYRQSSTSTSTSNRPSMLGADEHDQRLVNTPSPVVGAQ
ncbi:hypothetical protein Ddc_05581 [Ditylenchus destructor]|nr:hypothetical protein Ddc_05581 [Ditylenchus destructor]